MTLMQGATRVFQRHGLAATTVEMILVEAGIARATFYEHFSDKNDLVRAIIAAVWQRGDTIYSDFAALPAVDRPRLRAWLAATYDLWRSHFLEVELLLREMPGVIEAESGRHMDVFVDLIVGDGRRWACSVGEARCRAHLLIGQLDRGLSEVIRGSWPIDEDFLLDTLATLWEQAIHLA